MNNNAITLGVKSQNTINNRWIEPDSGLAFFSLLIIHYTRMYITITEENVHFVATLNIDCHSAPVCTVVCSYWFRSYFSVLLTFYYLLVLHKIYIYCFHAGFLTHSIGHVNAANKQNNVLKAAQCRNQPANGLKLHIKLVYAKLFQPFNLIFSPHRISASLTAIWHLTLCDCACYLAPTEKGEGGGLCAKGLFPFCFHSLCLQAQPFIDGDVSTIFHSPGPLWHIMYAISDIPFLPRK